MSVMVRRTCSRHRVTPFPHGNIWVEGMEISVVFSGAVHFGSIASSLAKRLVCVHYSEYSLTTIMLSVSLKVLLGN